jgi:hypothetical protein
VRSAFKTCVSLLPLAATGCSGAADIPATPDLSGLIANYNQPDGQVNASLARTVVSDTPPELEAALRATGVIASSVNDASTDTTPNKGSGVRLQGSINVDLRCPGALNNPVYDPATNGTASLTFAIADTKIKRTFGGVADHCVLSSMVAGTSVRTQLDGNIAFDMGNDIGIGQHWSGTLLAYLPGQLEVAGYTFTSVSARFTSDQLEHLVRLDDGTFVILTFNSTGVTVRDKDGTWLCPSDGSTCTQG